MKTRILVVDDNKLLRELICAFLAEEPDLEVVGQATDGLTAIRRAAALQPDVVTLDIEMPHLNGFQAAEVVREVSPLSKLVFISSDYSDEYLERAFECGALAFVAKDRIGDQLIETIKMVQAEVSPALSFDTVPAQLGSC